MWLQFCRQIFERKLNIKFHQNQPSGSRFVPCGQSVMTKLRVALQNFAKAPKKQRHLQAAQWFVYTFIFPHLLVGDKRG
jgi:hypothetical protein